MESVGIVLAILSPLAALIFGYFSFYNTRKHNEHKEAEDKTTVLIKLEHIGEDVKEIKSEVRDIKNDVSGLQERVAKVEASCASAHHRIDGLTK